ncbi:MAG: serine/threonine-protein kinase [Acidobacteriota bacterium]
MSYEHERRVFSVLDEALDAEPAGRGALLDRLCGDDAALRAEVDRLLAKEPSGILAAPAFDVHGRGDGAEGGVGRTIGDYRLVEVLGRGGMGTVYVAERVSFEQRVALKIIRRGLDLDPILVQRFENERQVLARLEHPGIARLLDGGSTAEGLPYVAMELVDGEPLDAYCRTRELGLRARLELFSKVLDAVGYAHQNLVVHRDLKPGNILVDAQGQPKLLDFGISKVLDDGLAASPLHTATGESPMTPRYASPEQIRRQPITTAADVYVLGVLLFELVTGVPAYATDDPAELTRWVCEREAERPSTAVRRRDGGLPGLDPERLRRRLAGDLDAIISKALRKAPAERYGSVEALADDLRRHLDGLPVRARRGDSRYRAAKFVRRHRLPLMVVSLIVLTIVGAAGAVAYYAVQAQEHAEREGRTAGLWRKLTDSPSRGETPVDFTRRALGELQGGMDLNSMSQEEIENLADLAGRFGRMQQNAGNLDQAELAAESAYHWSLRAVGPVDDQTLKHLNNLSTLLSLQGHLDEAVGLLRNVVRDQERAGVAEKLTFRPLSNLATTLKNRGDLEEAERLHRHVLERRLALNEDHRHDKDITSSRHNVAAVDYASGRFEASVRLARQALESRRRNRGEGASGTLNTQILVGQSLLALGRNEEAVEELEKALVGRVKSLGSFDVKVAIAQRHLAEALVPIDPECAEVLLTLAIETLRRGPDRWRLAEAQSVLTSLAPASVPSQQLAEAWADRVSAARGAESTPSRRAAERVLELDRRLLSDAP